MNILSCYGIILIVAGLVCIIGGIEYANPPPDKGYYYMGFQDGMIVKQGNLINFEVDGKTPKLFYIEAAK